MMDVQWFKDKIRKAGTSQNKIAERRNRQPSAISHIFRGQQAMSPEWAKAFAEELDVPISVIFEKAGVYSETDARSADPKFSEAEAVPFQAQGRKTDLSIAIKQAFGGERPGIDVWQVNTSAMALGGLINGDLMLVDSRNPELAKAHDIVIAQLYSWDHGSAKTVLRRYEPPVLVAASAAPDNYAVHVVDGQNVVIIGRILASWRVGF